MRDLLECKLTKPLLEQDIISRKSLEEKLASLSKVKFTVLTAGPGYGKTTALVQYLQRQTLPYSWYSLGPEDDNLYLFSVYLSGALDKLFPGFKKWYCDKLDQEGVLDWKTLYFTFMLGLERYGKKFVEGVLVIDDWQFVDNQEEIKLFFNRVLENLPGVLHVVILSREYIKLPVVEKARMRGNVLDLYPMDFLFHKEDIKKLFAAEKLTTPKQNELTLVVTQTEGWIMAIKLLLGQARFVGKKFWKNLALGEFEPESLFAYLSQEVFANQTPTAQDFLAKTALVEDFDEDFCQQVLGIVRPNQEIKEIIKKGLFIYRMGQHTYRYHSLLRMFLRQVAEETITNLPDLYAKIGAYYQKLNLAEKALPFLLKGGKDKEAASLLAQVGQHWVVCGRDKLFNYYLQQLPVKYQNDPAIFLALGDMDRVANRYEKAAGWYRKAEKIYRSSNNKIGQSHSNRSLGELYLDIIEPEIAQTYLRKAYKLLTEKQITEKAHLLYLMSENMINYGNSHKAKLYFRLWQHADPQNSADGNNLEARIALRTGRIKEAVSLMEGKQEDQDRMPCSFRESSLILSLCDTLLGETEQAIKAAQTGISYANQIQAPFVEVIGYTRLGFALMSDYKYTKELCWQNFNKALEIEEKLGIERGRTEIYWGQCLMHALDDNWQEAEQLGLEAVAITEKGRDKWFASELYLSLGLGAVLCHQYVEAEKYLGKALEGFTVCRDGLGITACYWQFCRKYYQEQNQEKFSGAYQHLLETSRCYGCSYLLKGKNMLGDLTGLPASVFQEYYKSGHSKKQIPKVKKQKKLRITTLGGLEIFLKGKPLATQQWRRKAAKQLLILLIAKRSLPMTKEALMAALWPEAGIKSAQTNFKVALNYLIEVLEPERKPRMDSKYIKKGDVSLQLLLGEDCSLDVEDFEKGLTAAKPLVEKAPREAEKILQQALALYKGEYLAGEYLDDDSLRERDWLHIMAIKGAETLVSLLVEEKQFEEALKWCSQIIAWDSSWERAYQLKMLCYGEMKRNALVEKVYRACVDNLDRDLGSDPSHKTKEIYKKYR